MTRLAAFVIGSMALCCAPASAQEEVMARGANPADNDTRLDVILKHNWLTDQSSIFTTTLKFDYRITP
jgi:hypothetical protein